MIFIKNLKLTGYNLAILIQLIFMIYSKKRRETNAIKCIRQSNCSHAFNRDEIAKEAISFNQNLFTDNNQEGDWVPLPRNILTSEAQKRKRGKLSKLPIPPSLPGQMDSIHCSINQHAI